MDTNGQIYFGREEDIPDEDKKRLIDALAIEQKLHAEALEARLVLERLMRNG